MPNNLVFNNVANELKTQIYGTTASGTLTPVLVGTNGDLTIRNLSSVTDTVSVTGNVSVVGTVNVRALSSVTDTVSVTGNVSVVGVVDVRPLSSVTDTVSVTGNVSVVGTVNVRALSSVTDTVSVTGIVEVIKDVASSSTVIHQTDAGPFSTVAENTSGMSMYSFYVKNAGTTPVTAQLQVSPTATLSYFVQDEPAVGIASGSSYVFVPKHYLNYTRLSYTMDGTGGTVEAYYNAQS